VPAAPTESVTVDPDVTVDESGGDVIAGGVQEGGGGGGGGVLGAQTLPGYTAWTACWSHAWSAPLSPDDTKDFMIACVEHSSDGSVEQAPDDARF
jgi:hypothetical protein